jgi:hypothetical protein
MQILSQIAEETIKTLGLLLPQVGWPECQTWYHSKAAEENLDPRAAEQGTSSRRAADYDYWRNRLLILQREFDTTDHATFPAYLIDRRRPKEWATMMATICAFIFAIIFAILTSITSIMSVVYGKESVDRANYANQLAYNQSTSAAAANNGTGNSQTLMCCCPSSQGNISYSTASTTKTLTAGTTPNSEVTVTDFISITATTYTTIDVTTTIIVTLPTAAENTR